MFFREGRIKVKSEELKVKSEEWRVKNFLPGPKGESENGTQAIRLKRNSSNSSEDKERKVKLMFN